MPHDIRNVHHTDLQGRPYAKVSEVKAGTKLECDGGFDCMHKGDIKIVEDAGDGLYIICDMVGGHYLAGQLDSTGTCYVGLYHVQET